MHTKILLFWCGSFPLFSFNPFLTKFFTLFFIFFWLGLIKPNFWRLALSSMGDSDYQRLAGSTLSLGWWRSGSQSNNILTLSFGLWDQLVFLVLINLPVNLFKIKVVIFCKSETWKILWIKKHFSSYRKHCYNIS